jgi:hypothetical protein
MPDIEVWIIYYLFLKGISQFTNENWIAENRCNGSNKLEKILDIAWN